MVLCFQTPEPVNLDLSDDEELANAMDYHSMIISSHHHTDDDHVVTADEVISELEIMMEVNSFISFFLVQTEFFL